LFLPGFIYSTAPTAAGIFLVVLGRCDCHIYLIACDFICCHSVLSVALCGGNGSGSARKRAKQTQMSAILRNDMPSRLAHQHTHTPAHILLVCHFVTAPPGSQQQGEKKGRENSTQVAFVVKSYLFISFLYFFFAANSAHSVSPFLFIFICWLLISIYILYCLSSRSCNFLA